ncbi:MAG: DUF4446 family protein [Lachnospiraceae bacterium]|nr:DUF4446 family protein [Lachnospiraceae bacterium]
MIEYYLGIDSDYVVIGLAALVLLLIIVMIINAARQRKLRKAYEIFMLGNDGKSLEDTLIDRLNQVDSLVEANAANERNIDTLFRKAKQNFRKFGLVKYDALQEMGGKLSFTLCMLDEKNDGFILNVVHSREGCYSYVKEIIDTNSIVALAEEEEEALSMALGEK